jgi:hypothetical protein
LYSPDPRVTFTITKQSSTTRNLGIDIVRPPLSDLRQPLFDNPLWRRGLHTLQAASNRRLLARFDRADASRRQARALLTLVHHSRLTPFGLDHDFGRIRTPQDFRRLVPLQRLPGRTSPGAESPHKHALGVALALTQEARPHAVCWLGDGPISERFPLLALPCVFGPTTLPWMPSPTCVIGPVDRVVAFSRDRQHLAPDVRAVVYSRGSLDSSPDALRTAVGPVPVLLELLSRPEGPIAVEDPRYGGLRLLVDAGVYFEFIPATGTDQANPPRLGLDEVRVGVPYELAFTAPAGIWAGRSGLTVVFDRVDPPLIRVVTTPAPVAERRAVAETVQAPHRSSTGIPAAPRGTFAHTPWSARADRG